MYQETGDHHLRHVIVAFQHAVAVVAVARAATVDHQLGGHLVFIAHKLYVGDVVLGVHLVDVRLDVFNAVADVGDVGHPHVVTFLDFPIHPRLDGFHVLVVGNHQNAAQFVHHIIAVLAVVGKVTAVEVVVQAGGAHFGGEVVLTNVVKIVVHPYLHKSVNTQYASNCIVLQGVEIHSLAAEVAVNKRSTEFGYFLGEEGIRAVRIAKLVRNGGWVDVAVEVPFAGSHVHIGQFIVPSIEHLHPSGSLVIDDDGAGEAVHVWFSSNQVAMAFGQSYHCGGFAAQLHIVEFKFRAGQLEFEGGSGSVGIDHRDMLGGQEATAAHQGKKR